MPEVVINNAPQSRGTPADRVGVANARWWRVEIDPKQPTAVHHELVPYLGLLQTTWRPMAMFDRLHDRIYENRHLRPGGTLRPAAEALERVGLRSARLMVTTSIVDTFVSRIMQRRPMPAFVVDDAEWSLKRKAQEYRRFLQGKMLETDYDRLCPELIRDACVRGTGIQYIDDHEDDVIAERAHRSEILVDPYEALAGARGLRTMGRVRRVSRDVLAERYPDCKAQIFDAPPAKLYPHETHSDDWAGAGLYESGDTIEVFEAWHLPSGRQAKDGRAAVAIDGATLYFGEWETPRFPFVALHRYKPQTGFWGRGDVALLADIQARINAIVRTLQQNLDVGSNLIVFQSATNKIPAEMLTGYRPFAITVPPGPGKPEFVAPTPVNQAVVNMLLFFIQQAHELTGVSQWATSSKNPIGAGASGVALDTFYDIESQRHAWFEDDYAHARIDAAERYLDAARRIVKRKEAEAKHGKAKTSFTARWMDKGTVRAIDWKNAALDEEQYRLQIEPVNFVPSTRGGKLATVTELSKAGVIPQWATAALFDEPDLAHLNRVTLAAYKNAERMMEELGDEKVNPAPLPEPYHDLELLLIMSRAYYNRAQSEGAPEAVLARYRDFIELVQDKIDEGKSAAAAPPAPDAAGAMLTPDGMGISPLADAGGGAPMPMPMPPPGAAAGA